MQTEQQKILWIIFSVALFILVVVGVGVIWFLPANQRSGATATVAQSSGQNKINFDPYEWAKSKNSSYPGLESAPAKKPGSPTQGNGNFTIIYGQSPGQTQAASQPAPAPAPKTQAPPPPPAPRPAPRAQPAPQVAPAPAPRPQPRATPPAPAVQRSHVAAPPQTTRVVQHWIQVASFTSDFRAERAKKVLGQNGIAGKIISHEIRGRTFFRVRVGPYVSQQQAEKFLGEIKKISEFRNSYISLVYAIERAN